MATRKDLATIKAARNGLAEAQIALGKRYLFGGDGLPRSEVTAYHWLRKAAIQGQDEACVLIAKHIPYSVIESALDSQSAFWFKKAFLCGVRSAGVVFGRLILEKRDAYGAEVLADALLVLAEMAAEGDTEAQWLFSKYHIAKKQLNKVRTEESRDLGERSASVGIVRKWITDAADAGIEEAQFSLLEQLWNERQIVQFHERSVDLIEGVVQQFTDLHMQYSGEHTSKLKLSDEISLLLMRSVEVQRQLPIVDIKRIQRILEIAAMAGEVEAMFELGLLHAQMDKDGNRIQLNQGAIDYDKSIYCLSYAGRQAHAKAWYALFLVHLNSDFPQSNEALGQNYLTRAAELGDMQAQFECGRLAWLNRHCEEDSDIRALYWWQKAKAQGHSEAAKCIQSFSNQALSAPWAEAARKKLAPNVAKVHPFLWARLEMAEIFGLSKSEALLIDVRTSDRGHCLLVDTRAMHARGTRRLIVIETEEQRVLLNKVSRLFRNIDCGQGGPEGSYRARQERLARLLAR